MNVIHINPFVQSVINVFNTMLDCPIQREGLTLKDGAFPTYDVTSIIGLSGLVRGSVVVSLSREVAFKVVERMLGTEAVEINLDVVDAVGELANMVAGGAKAELSQYELSLGLPTVVVGKNHIIHFPDNVRPLQIPFKTPWGPMSLEVGLDSKSTIVDTPACAETVCAN